jgi:eukaryotic-like serine/threonine-protein kinase
MRLGCASSADLPSVFPNFFGAPPLTSALPKPPSMPVRTATLYEPGYVIADKYELETILGEGGMGAVWRARNIALDSPVAIKVVRSEGDLAALRSRLLQEARAAAKLSHPAIVKVFDVGQTENGDPFIVMELLPGNSLGAILATEGRLTSVQTVRTLLPIIDALWLAHGKGIVHRDLKPDNVLIVQDDTSLQPKLVDFGIVKVQVSEGESHLTQDGVVLGSPDYMSPEQARGEEDVDHRTDVWALCVVLYEAISGAPPFKGNNYNALLRQIVEATPPSLRELAVADEELSGIVARGLSKRREERFASMGELGRALATWLIGHGVHEDICGTTVDTKWLRGTDPHGRPARASMASINDAWPPEGGSGVRPNALRPIHSLPATASQPVVADGPKRRAASRGRVLALAAAAAACLILGWLLFGSGPESPAAVPAAARPPPLAGHAAGAVQPLPAPVSGTSPVADPSVDAVPSEKAARRSPGKVSSKARVPAKGGSNDPAASSQPPAAAPKPSGRGDLISPY